MNSQVRHAISVAEARRVIRDLKIRTPEEIDLSLIAATYDVLVREENLTGVEARLVRSNKQGIISVRMSLTPPGRKRFAIAHELGHFFLHPQTRQLALCTDRDMNTWASGVQAEETEANEFAAELLMPQDIFEPILTDAEPGFDLIAKLADHFSTTLTASAIQFVKYTIEPCLLVFSDGKSRKRFTSNAAFSADFRIRDDTAIHPYSCANEILRDQKDHIRADDVPAGAWLDGFDSNNKGTVTEDSIRLGSYGTVLSLIWISKII